MDGDFVVIDRTTSAYGNKPEYRMNFKEGISDGKTAFARR
jgi:hypothetical protein